MIKNEANKSLNAKFDFDRVNLSVIRNFPDLTVGMKNLSIIGIDDFEEDTLVYIPDSRLTISLRSILKGDKYEIKTVRLSNLVLKLRVLADGRVNWDIIKPSTDTIRDAIEEAPSTFSAALRSMKVQGGKIIYDDATFPMYVEAGGASIDMSGDLSLDFSDLLAEVSVETLDADYDGIRHLNKAKASLNSKIGVDLVAWKFTFPDAKLKLNELDILVSGFFAMPDEGYDVDVNFETLKNDFKSFLSMVPAIYSKDFESVQASGKLALNGFVKGFYSDTSMPGFGVIVEIADAMFRYPDLPESVENISMKAGISNATGDPDATIIDVTKLHFEMAKNPVDLRLYVATPVSDPFIDTKIKGKINLADVGKFYPLEGGDEMSGMIDADITANGKLSAVEQKHYDQFAADGRIIAANVVYKTSSLPEGLSISEAKLKLTPALAAMSVLKAKIGKNDFSASGNLNNPMAYFFSKGDLQGTMELSSTYFNVNDFMPESSKGAGADTSSLAVIEIPKGIDFTMNATFDQVIYDNMDLRNLKGRLLVKDQKLKLENVNMNTLDGAIGIIGSYSTVIPDKPVVDFVLDIRDVDVQKAFTTFNTMQKLAPIAGLAKGNISTKLSLKTDLDGKMMPVFSSIMGDGNLRSQMLTFSNVKSFNKLADALKMDKLKEWVIEKVNLSFEVLDGKVFVKPFETEVGKTKAEISGWNSFDETMEYVMQLSIPRSEFGGAANNVLNNLVSEANKKGANFSVGDVIPIAVLITGTVRDPKVSTDLKIMASNVIDDMKKQMIETLQEKKEEAVARLREEADNYLEEANIRAQKILSEAQKQADEVMRLANESATKIRTEADKQAEQLIAEGKQNGTIAEMAAKRTADKLKGVAYEKADMLVSEAQVRSDNLMSRAREESDRIVQEARDKAAGN
ncbi:MAG: hypothetical protein K0B15_12670 [Lentimicrobium sp.]|nr:hypothetical protein [Lentimicrobium sp.]